MYIEASNIIDEDSFKKTEIVILYRKENGGENNPVVLHNFETNFNLNFKYSKRLVDIHNKYTEICWI